jgi:hypothetical protein
MGMLLLKKRMITIKLGRSLKFIGTTIIYLRDQLIKSQGGHVMADVTLLNVMVVSQITTKPLELRVGTVPNVILTYVNHV